MFDVRELGKRRERGGIGDAYGVLLAEAHAEEDEER